MAISFFSEGINFTLKDKNHWKKWLKSVIEAEGYKLKEISYIFCDDEYLHKINLEYLQHDTYTDIITFDSGEGDSLRGEMYISTERVADNAQTEGVSFGHELCRVMVHGLLHLAGYGDKTPEQEALMRQKEDFYLAQLPFSI